MKLTPLSATFLFLGGSVGILFLRPLLGGPMPGAVAGAAVAEPDPEVLTIYYHERRPYYFAEEGRVGGLVVEPVAAALTQARIPHRWVPLPPARQLRTMRETTERCAGIGWTANDERRAFARFSLAVRQDGPLVALTWRDEDRLQDGRPLAALLGDRSLLLLVKDSYSYGREVDDLIRLHQPRSLSTPSPNDAMLRMLIEGRADYFLLAREEADALVASAGNPPVRIVSLGDSPHGIVRHLMFNRAVPADIVARFNAAWETRHTTAP